jgi:hypothetical protein
MDRKPVFLIALLLMAVSLAPFAPELSALHSSTVGQMPGRIGAGQAFPIQLAISDSQAYTIAADALTAYFRDVLMKTQEFKDTYGDIAWEDISEEVVDSIDIVRDRKMEKSQYADAQFAFTGWIFDMYAEIVLDRVTGAVRKVVIELE